MKLVFNLALLSGLGAQAFTVPSSSNHGTVQTMNVQQTLFTTKLYMSDEDEDEEPISDELSKLIGKRASMLKKKSAEQKPTASELADEDYINPKTASLYEGKSGMDIFEMPDFQTARPLKTPKKVEQKKDEKSDDDGDYYIDFQAEYDDENDLHIPNRIGFTTKDWGDTSAGFKAGKKLKKKEIKAGKFLSGDLQVSMVARRILFLSYIVYIYKLCPIGCF